MAIGGSDAGTQRSKCIQFADHHRAAGNVPFAVVVQCFLDGADWTVTSGMGDACDTTTSDPSGICGDGGPSPNATPELDSLVLLGTGLTRLATYARLRFRGRHES
jgi:hypothetical protein